jgi:molybdopterin/thiamine biosynthesis adenylyltransferase
MNESDARHAITAALRQREFERDWKHPAHLRFRGNLDPSGLHIPVSIEVPDLDFVNIPVVRIDPGGIRTRNMIPHLSGADDQLCYLDAGSTVLDRYDPGGTVLRCLMRAEEVLGDAVRGKLNDDFVDEYANYWSSKTLLVDLPADAIGETEIFWVFLNCGDEEGTPILTRKGKLARSFRDAHERARGPGVKPSSEACWVVSVDVPLGCDPNASVPPANLAEMLMFMAACRARTSVIDEAFRRGDGLSRWIAIRAPNAFCLARIMIPRKFDKDEFMKSRKQSLPRTVRTVASDIELERWRGFPIDAGFLYGRNLGSAKGLAGKKIGLIGCGTIGSFLALQLAQSGAGSMGGRLVLFDNQILTSSNLGRHLLGLPHLGRNKAEGCAEVIRAQLPFLDIEARPVDVLRRFQSLDEFDLVIDATGEEALSLALNDFAVNRRPDFPPILYSWIVGNGAAVQAMLCDGPNHACYKCSKPELSKEPRVRVLRNPAELSLQRMGACGDGLYAPFPVSVSMVAASLAHDLILGWNNGKPGARLRTRAIDLEQSFAVKDTTLAPSAVCPACRGTAA